MWTSLGDTELQGRTEEALGNKGRGVRLRDAGSFRRRSPEQEWVTGWIQRLGQSEIPGFAGPRRNTVVSCVMIVSSLVR